MKSAEQIDFCTFADSLEKTVKEFCYNLIMLGKHPFTCVGPHAFCSGTGSGSLSVRLRIISWDDIHSELDEEAHSLSVYQRKMAKQMAEMHGGGMRGDYHVLVTIDDVASGQRIEDTEAEVVVYNKDKQSENVTLEQMLMDGFAGYGGFIRFNLEDPYSILIFFKRASVGETVKPYFRLCHFKEMRFS